MRGDATQQLEMLSPVTPDTLVPRGRPIREIRPIVDRALSKLSPVFDAMYASGGRPSIPPEHLLKAMLLQAFYSIRSERQLCERPQYDLLFKWFVGLNILDPVFDHSTFSKNRDRLGGRATDEARHAGHVLMENRNGLIVDILLTPADGHAERRAARAISICVRRESG